MSRRRKQEFDKQEFNRPSKSARDALGLDILRAVHVAAPDLEQIAELIRKGANLEVRKGSSGATPLQYTVLYRRSTAFELLLEQSPSQKNLDGALYIAAARGEMKFLEKLLWKGACPNTEIVKGQVLLVMAAGQQHVDMVERFLYHGTNPDLRDDQGRTALFMASDGAGDKGFEIARMLIRYGRAAVDIADERGATPLMMAAVTGNARAGDIAELLLEAGADPYLCDRNGDTALTLAQKNGRKRMAQIVEQGMAAQKEKYLRSMLDHCDRGLPLQAEVETVKRAQLKRRDPRP